MPHRREVPIETASGMDYSAHKAGEAAARVISRGPYGWSWMSHHFAKVGREETCKRMAHNHVSRDGSVLQPASMR